MELFWTHGKLFVKDMVELMPDPKPHFNTVSTQVRTLEMEGFLKHKAYGGSHQYEPAITREEYSRSRLSYIADKYYNKSYLGVVSSLVKDEKLSVDELKALIAELESGK